MTVKGDQRYVEAVAEADEAACLITGIDIEHSGKIGWLIGNDTYRTACKACKTNDDILCKVGHYFEEIAVVYHSFDNVLHVIRHIRIGRYYRI